MNEQHAEPIHVVHKLTAQAFAVLIAIVIAGLLSVVGEVGILTLLPFQGQELGIVGVIVLLYATYLLVQKIIRPITCEIQ